MVDQFPTIITTSNAMKWNRRIKETPKKSEELKCSGVCERQSHWATSYKNWVLWGLIWFEGVDLGLLQLLKMEDDDGDVRQRRKGFDAMICHVYLLHWNKESRMHRKVAHSAKIRLQLVDQSLSDTEAKHIIRITKENK